MTNHDYHRSRDGNYRAQVFEFRMGKTERSMRGHHLIIFA